MGKLSGVYFSELEQVPGNGIIQLPLRIFAILQEVISFAALRWVLARQDGVKEDSIEVNGCSSFVSSERHGLQSDILSSSSTCGQMLAPSPSRGTLPRFRLIVIKSGICLEMGFCNPFSVSSFEAIPQIVEGTTTKVFV